MWIGLAAVAGVLLTLGVMLGSGGSSQAAEPTRPAAAGAGSKAQAQAQHETTPGRAPDWPAPKIDPLDLGRAEEIFARAKDRTNEAKLANRAGEKGKSNIAAREAWTEFEQMGEVLRAYTDWLEEADLGEWQIPAEYEELRSRLGRYDRVRVHVKKLSKAPRR